MSATLVWTALLMGLAGGSHCLIMCAAPCAAVTGAGTQSGSPEPVAATAVVRQVQPIQWQSAKPVLTRQIAYHLGRVAGYASMGALAAVAFQSLGWATQHSAALRPLWTLAHVAVLAWGLMMLLRARQPAWVEAAGRTVWAKVRPVVTRPGGVFVTGFLWSLMPCGLLYSALLVAALSTNAAQGALAMAAFALGSGLWLWAGPWAWGALLRKLDRRRADWGTRLGGGLLCGVAVWALWQDLIVRPSLICQ